MIKDYVEMWETSRKSLSDILLEDSSENPMRINFVKTR
jgi:hypothetical protein